MSEYIPYDLSDVYDEAEIFFIVCDLWRSSDNELNKRANEISKDLSFATKKSLSFKFDNLYQQFRSFKPEILNYDSLKKNYVCAYKYGAFNELRQFIKDDIAGKTENKQREIERNKHYSEIWNDKTKLSDILRYL